MYIIIVCKKIMIQKQICICPSRKSRIGENIGLFVITLYSAEITIELFIGSGKVVRDLLMD